MILLNRFLRDESGAAAIEYGLLAALIAVAIIVSLVTLSSSMTAFYTDFTRAIRQAIGLPI